MRIEIDPNLEDGEITIDAIDLWWLLNEEQQEEILMDNAHWRIVKRALKSELGHRLATPNFNSSVHKLREMIVTDAEFVNDITVRFITQILKEWAGAEQKAGEAKSAFYNLYNNLPDECDKYEYKTPYDVNKDDYYMRFSTKEVKKEIMENFVKLLREYDEKN